VNKEIPMVNLLIRTSPAEDPIRFSVIQTKYPFIKWNFPDWKISRGIHQEAWSQRVPGLDDVADLRAILTYSDLNINMLSTMSLDFMQFDKPVINPVFGNLENGLYNDQRFLAYEHIKHVVNSEATMIVKNKTELVDAMNLLMEKPTLLVKGQHDLISLQIGVPLEGTGKRMAQTLLQWA
jgi:CDP-glycerol glycerophosphotransferase (TagB/SpsB family)